MTSMPVQFPWDFPSIFTPTVCSGVGIQDFFFWPKHPNSSSVWLQNYINKDETLVHANCGKTPTDSNKARLSPHTFQNVQTQIENTFHK